MLQTFMTEFLQEEKCVSVGMFMTEDVMLMIISSRKCGFEEKCKHERCFFVARLYKEEIIETSCLCLLLLFLLRSSLCPFSVFFWGWWWWGVR
jgi:hypothetical protein